MAEKRKYVGGVAEHQREPLERRADELGIEELYWGHVRLERRVDELEKRLESRVDDLQSRVDGLEKELAELRRS